MTLRALRAGLALALFVASLMPQVAFAQDKTPGRFDFYVLSLSWSPTFCASSRGKDSPDQCGTDRKYSFIVHGLWPQNDKGYPEFCTTKEPRRVPDALGRSYFDIMPSMGLIGHQWRKHGSCSGLTQSEYLAKTREAFAKITLPPGFSNVAAPQTLSAEAIEQSFMRANPGMPQTAIAVSCEGSRLEEVRICLTKDLGFRPCAEVDRKGCTINRVTVPPPR